ncbi:MAG TPA: winged helix DNA-binding domain-containing protein, partial [Candidatus Dormibacteraeota bacterium]|nr:winged helix DNA-binding domain-containing protein [Candidatus Dormibacteraeota bacterium]
MKWAQALAWRMRRHRLVERARPDELVTVAGEICGLHAQVMSSAELSLWARIDGLRRDAIRRALWQRRALVKLWAMRGTLHLLPSRDLGVWLSALGTYAGRQNSPHPAMSALVDAIRRTLDGRMLTREELAAAIEETTGDRTLGEWVRFSWGSYLKAASFRGSLCFAPSEGGRVRFTTPAAWVGEAAMERPAAADGVRAVARSYLAAYAPASAADIAMWWGGGRRQGPAMLAALGDEAVELDVEGQRTWALASDVAAMATTPPARTARLLPGFDPWTIGALIGKRPADPCESVLTVPGHRRRIFSPQGWVSPVLLVDGRMAGVWTHARKAGTLVVTLEPFEKLPAWAQQQLEA